MKISFKFSRFLYFPTVKCAFLSYVEASIFPEYNSGYIYSMFPIVHYYSKLVYVDDEVKRCSFNITIQCSFVVSLGNTC